MPPMDQQCFCSTKNVHVNYMSVSGYDGEALDKTRHRQVWEDLVRKFPKFRYKVVNKFGDHYYEEMSFETAFERAYHYETDLKKTLKNQNDIDHYMRDNINKKVPLDGPQWRMMG